MTRLRELREQEDWTQDQLVREIERASVTLKIRLPGRGSLITNISRWENGRITPGPDYLRILRHIFAASDVDMGFGDDSETWSLPSTQREDQVTYFERLFDEHVAADNLVGSAYVGPLVADQTRQLLMLTSQARGPTRRGLVEVTARFEEFLGWLNQDTGRLEAAMHHTDRARDLALELGDNAFNAYLLMRKSNIASDAGDGPLALGLSEAALSAATDSTPDVRAVILRQKANAHALLGEAEDCGAAIEGAFDALTDGKGERSRLAPYCTPEYVAMDAGECWVALGDNDRALSAFALASSPSVVLSKRDHGLALSRAAHAYALAGDRVTACSAAALAIEAAQLARSGRVIRELRAVRGTLRKRWPGDDQCRAIIGAVGRLAAGG